MARITLTLDDSTIQQLIRLAGGPRRVSLYMTGIIKDLDAGHVLGKPTKALADVQREVATLKAAIAEAENRQRTLVEKSAAISALLRGLNDATWHGAAETTVNLVALKTAVELAATETASRTEESGAEGATLWEGVN